MLWQCGWSGTNTPPDEGAILHLGVLALCQLSALSHSGKCRFNTFKQFVIALRGPHLLWRSPAQARHVRISARTKTFGLKAIASQIEKQLAHHARLTTNLHRATRAENFANCWNCDTNVCSESRSDLLAQQRIYSSGLTEVLLAFHPSCITSSCSSTFPDSLRSAPLYSIQLQSTTRRLTRFQISPTRFQIRRDSVAFWPDS